MRHDIHGRMGLLEYLNLISNFEGSTIKIEVSLLPANKIIKHQKVIPYVILDTGADTTALTRNFLTKSGYGVYSKSGNKKNTATGEVELLTCEINGITIASQFKFGKMKVDLSDN